MEFGSNKKLQFGLENVHVAFRDSDTGNYEKPIHVPGAVNLSLSAEGDSTPFYADNIAYFTLTSNNGYSGDLEMALVPENVLALMLGWETDSNGMLIELTNGVQREFALMYEVEGNKNNKRYIFYSCKASRPTEDHSTNTETKEPNTQTLTLKVLPTTIGAKKAVKGVLELSVTNEAVYNAFFDEVIIPNAVPSAVSKLVLNSTIALAGTLEEADYTPLTWSDLSSALSAASGLGEGATQAEVNLANDNLQEAILSLVAA